MNPLWLVIVGVSRQHSTPAVTPAGQDERLPPRGPSRPQYRSESGARSLAVQSQQSPMESQGFEYEALPRTESADHPAEDMSERRDHGKSLTGKVPIELCAESFILQEYDVLARSAQLACRESAQTLDVRLPGFHAHWWNQWDQRRIRGVAQGADQGMIEGRIRP